MSVVIPDRVLAIDTSGGELLLAIVDSNGKVAGIAEAGGRHQERVIEAIIELAGGSGLADLTAVAVANGPGSHTGLRVGLATAEGIAFARRLPIYRLSSLAVAAHRARLQTGAVTALVNAGRGRVYAQPFTVALAARRAQADAALGEVAGLSPGMVAGEAAVMAAAADAGHAVAPLLPGDEALVAAVIQAVGEDLPVAYHELRGEYGDLTLELTH